MFGEQPAPPHRRELRQPAPQVLDPYPVQLERRNVRLGEIAVVLGEFLAPLRERALLGLRPASRLLHDGATRFEHLLVALDLEDDRAMESSERVDVLQLGLHAQLARPFVPDRDVGLHAHLPPLHLRL